MSNPISFSLQIVGERWAYPLVVDYRWCSGETGKCCAHDHILNFGWIDVWRIWRTARSGYRCSWRCSPAQASLAGGAGARPDHPITGYLRGRQRFRSRWNVCIARKHKLKGGATPLVRARPEASAMRLDDRTADREAQPQAGRLRRVEGLEHPLEHRYLKSRTRILNRNQHAAGFFCCA